jgi:hypothetical protein
MLCLSIGSLALSMQADKVRDSFKQGMTIESFIGWSPDYQTRQHRHLSLFDSEFYGRMLYIHGSGTLKRHK